VGFSAFRSPSNLWATTLFSAAFGVLVMGLVNLVVRKQRAYWGGFCVCGWAYFVAAFGPLAIEPKLVTTAVLDMAYPYLANGRIITKDTSDGTVRIWSLDPPQQQATTPRVWLRTRLKADPNARWLAWTATAPVSLECPENFRTIGHSLFTLVIAAVGGCYGRLSSMKSQAGTGPGESHNS
jgi:hypothetical protein